MFGPVKFKKDRRWVNLIYFFSTSIVPEGLPRPQKNTIINHQTSFKVGALRLSALSGDSAPIL